MVTNGKTNWTIRTTWKTANTAALLFAPDIDILPQNRAREIYNPFYEGEENKCAIFTISRNFCLKVAKTERIDICGKQIKTSGG